VAWRTPDGVLAAEPGAGRAAHVFQRLQEPIVPVITIRLPVQRNRLAGPPEEFPTVGADRGTAVVWAGTSPPCDGASVRVPAVGNVPATIYACPVAPSDAVNVAGAAAAQ
jgi:hypothetical protein